MPGSRDPNKALASFWMHKEIYRALGVASKTSGVTMTRFILEALAAKMDFALDETGNPVGLDLRKLTRTAPKIGAPSPGKKTEKQ